MPAPESIFLDFRLPNATTWFYFSFLLAIALFFKFTRLLSVRNWDVVSLFFLVPGLLLIQQAHLTAPLASEPLETSKRVAMVRLSLADGRLLLLPRALPVRLGIGGTAGVAAESQFIRTGLAGWRAIRLFGSRCDSTSGRRTPNRREGLGGAGAGAAPTRGAGGPTNQCG